MSLDNSSPQKRERTVPVFTILVVSLLGPLLVAILAGARLVLAPPQMSLTLMIYSGLFFLSVPLGLVALWSKRLRSRGCLAVVALTLFGFLAIASLAGPWLVANIPGTSTQCEPLAASPPQVRYTCSSFSSDSGQTREFVLQGREGWPVMRVVSVESEQ